MSVEILKCSDLVLKIDRPEYMASPEGLLSAVAWEGLSLRPPVGDSSKIGLVFEGTPSQGKGRKTFVLRPDSNVKVWTADYAWLERAGLNLEGNDEGHPDLLLDGILNSVEGVKPEKSRTRAASPMSVNLALLQNPVGMVGKNGPAPYASILETMFRWGGDQDAGSVKELWNRAVQHRLSADRLLKRVDSVAEQILQQRLADAGVDRGRSSHAVRQESVPKNGFIRELSTPYSWFYQSWMSLTSDQWVDALGPRIWTDWLTAVLRLTMAMGYLWECHYYLAIADAVLGESCESLERHLAGETQLLPWVTANATKTQRNVLPAIRDVVRRGNAIREFCGKSDLIQSLVAQYGEEPLIERISSLRVPAVRDQLRERIRKGARFTGGSAKTLHESIVSSLQARGTSDYYGLLRRTDSRNVVVAPGVDWVALIASLACRHPGGETNLREFNRFLRQLGLQGPAIDVVRLLETAGLATGSADADEGVRITSAF